MATSHGTPNVHPRHIAHNFVWNAGTLVWDAETQPGAGGGGDGAITDGVTPTIKATVLDLVSSNPLAVAITDAAGAQITSFGGGTQYTEGDVDASITGTALLWEDAGDTLRAVSAAKPLPISDAAGSITIDNPVLSVVGGGTEATAQRVTIATDSTGVLSVDDNGASLTIDSTQLPAALVGGRLDENIGAWLGSTAPTVGSKVSANSVPVVIASDQAAYAVTIANLDVALSTRLKPADTLTAVTTVTNLTGGTTAHDAPAVAINPVLIGVYASAAAPADVSADNDAVRLWALRNGSLVAQSAYAGVLATVNNGIAGTGVPRITLASDSTGNIATIGTSVVPGTGATHLGKAEDAAHTSGDTGVMALSVRTDVLAAQSTATADYQALQSDAYGRLSTYRKDTFAINQVPAVATQATISRAAAGAGVKNVCTSLSISLSSTAAPTAGSVIFNLRDGATGAGTILWSIRLSIPGVAGQGIIHSISDLWIEGTANTAMTLESSAAPAAATFATVSWTGTITQ